MRQTVNSLALEHPKELSEFTRHGVTFVRESAVWAPAVYTATDRFGQTWRVTSQGTKRNPWTITTPDGDVFRARTLVLAALWISRYAKEATS